ncbi:hypothetical protein F5Y17DRAFT_310091 [Xylariaceae sp. FL0594]|nr:hypothetical protein F5Y17DRAFT_310091 [Xylariaceae sp. FL0594]
MGDGQVDATQWPGEIIGEEDTFYCIKWEPTFEPKENASAALVKAWEVKKAAIGTQQDTNRVSSKPPTQGGTRVVKAQSAVTKGRGRSRGRPRLPR